jgi:hypothetical protein
MPVSNSPSIPIWGNSDLSYHSPPELQSPDFVQEFSDTSANNLSIFRAHTSPGKYGGQRCLAR